MDFSHFRVLKNCLSSGINRFGVRPWRLHFSQHPSPGTLMPTRAGRGLWGAPQMGGAEVSETDNSQMSFARSALRLPLPRVLVSCLRRGRALSRLWPSSQKDREMLPLISERQKRLTSLRNKMGTSNLSILLTSSMQRLTGKQIFILLLKPALPLGMLFIQK